MLPRTMWGQPPRLSGLGEAQRLGPHSYNQRISGTDAMTTKSLKKQKAERPKEETKINNDAPPAAKWPDFAACAEEIFGDRVLGTGDDFLKYRHREWELAMETGSPLREKTRPTQVRRSARRPGSRAKGTTILDV